MCKKAILKAPFEDSSTETSEMTLGVTYFLFWALLTGAQKRNAFTFLSFEVFLIKKNIFFTLTVGGVRGSLRCICLGLPWLKSINPFGSVVLKSNEMDPAFFAVHLLSATYDSGVSKVTGSSVATLSHLKDTTPLTWDRNGKFPAFKGLGS